jgi:hypothetical protein
VVPLALLALLEELDEELVRSPEELGDVGAPSPPGLDPSCVFGLLFLKTVYFVN